MSKPKKIEKAYKVIFNWTDNKYKGKNLSQIFGFQGIDVYSFFKSKLIIGGLNLKYSNLDNNLERWIQKNPLNFWKNMVKKLQFNIAKTYLKILFKLEQFRTKIRKKKKYKKSKGEKILFLTYANQASIENKKLRVYRLNRILDLIRENQRFKFKVASVKPLTYLRNVQIKHPNLICVEEYFNSSVFKKAYREAKRITRKWRELDEDYLKSTFSVGSDTFYPFIKDELNLYFSVSWLSFAFLYFFAFKDIFEINNIK